MHFRLYDSKGEELVHKIHIINIIRWLQDNKYFKNHPDEVLQLEYLPLSNEIRHKVISYTQMRIDEVSDDSSNLDVSYEECKDFTNSD